MRHNRINDSYKFGAILIGVLLLYFLFLGSCTVDGAATSASDSNSDANPSPVLELLSPVDGALGIDTTSSSLNFEWKSSYTNASYELLLSTENPPKTSRVTGLTTNSFEYDLVNSLELNAKYYWQIIATLSDASNKVKSSVHSFTTNNGLSVVDLPNADEVAVGSQLFSWKISNKLITADYNFFVYINDKEDFSDLANLKKEAVNITDSGVSINLSSINNLVLGAKYYWKLVAEHKTDTSKNIESESLTFTTERTERKVFLTSPANQALDLAIGVPTDLKWSLDVSITGTTTHRLFLDSDKQKVESKDASVEQSTSGGSASFTSTSADFGKTYFWKVIATNNGTDYESAMYQFSMEPEISVSATSPEDGAQNLAYGDRVFEWTLPPSFKTSGATTSLYLDTVSPPVKKVDVSASPATSTESYTYKATGDVALGDQVFGKTYYWKLETTKSGITTSITERSFTLEAGIVASSPADGATDIAVSNIAFSWTLPPSFKTANATTDIYLYKKGQAETKVGAVSNSAETYTHNGNLMFGTTYYWRLMSTNALLVSSSPVYSFTTQVANVAIAGFVTSSNGGPGVDGSTVTLESVDGNTVFATTTTASDGSFTLNSIEGEFAVVARKTGRAKSKTITYMESGMPILGLQQFPAVYTEKTNDLPEILVWDASNQIFAYNSIVGQNASSFEIRYQVRGSYPLTPTFTDGRRNSIQVTLNSSNSLTSNIGSYNTLSYSTPVLSSTINVKRLPANKSYIEFKAYDSKNNQTKKIIPINNALTNEDMSPSLTKPGLKSTPVYIDTTTYGEDQNIYSVGARTTAKVQIEIAVELFKHDGVMVYRGTTSSNTKYIGSINATSSLELRDGNFFASYTDTSPELVDGRIYIYTFKYFYTDSNTNKIITSEMSDEFRVPILPRLKLSHVSPAKDAILTNPTQIDFTWETESDLSFLLNDTSFAGSSLQRKDTYEVIETISRAIKLSGTVTRSGSDAGSDRLTRTWDLRYLPTPYKNKLMYWYVQSTINYSKSVSGGSDTDPKYTITAYSEPSGGSKNQMHNTSQEGASYFSIQ